MPDKMYQCPLHRPPWYGCKGCGESKPHLLSGCGWLHFSSRSDICPPCQPVPASKPESDEVMQKQHEDWVKAQHFEPEPAEELNPPPRFDKVYKDAVARMDEEPIYQLPDVGNMMAETQQTMAQVAHSKPAKTGTEQKKRGVEMITKLPLRQQNYSSSDYGEMPVKEADIAIEAYNKGAEDELKDCQPIVDKLDMTLQMQAIEIQRYNVHVSNLDAEIERLKTDLMLEKQGYQNAVVNFKQELLKLKAQLASSLSLTREERRIIISECLCGSCSTCASILSKIEALSDSPEEKPR